MIPAEQAHRKNRTEARVPVQITPRFSKGKTYHALVPLRDGHDEISLPPDLYALRATLPNGTLVTQTVDLRKAAEGAQIPVVFDLEEEAPNEDSGWAYLLGRSQRNLKRAITQERRVGGALGFARPKLQGPIIVFWQEKTDRWEQQTDRGWNGMSHPFRDPKAVLRLTGRVNPAERVWLEIRHRVQASKFVLLPPSGEELTTRVLIVRDPPEVDDGDPWNVVVETGGEAASVLLAYLQNGNFEAAQQVSEDFLPKARELMLRKFHDFTSALIAGYYLHKSGAWTLDSIAGQSRTVWQDWLRNLDEEFSAHADGPVIRAWSLLRSGDGAAARERLLEAEKRGLPIFRMGTRLLIDGLQFFSSTNREDDEVSAALSRIRLRTSTMDWNSPNTTAWGRISLNKFVSAQPLSVEAAEKAEAAPQIHA